MRRLCERVCKRVVGVVAIACAACVGAWNGAVNAVKQAYEEHFGGNAEGPKAEPHAESSAASGVHTGENVHLSQNTPPYESASPAAENVPPAGRTRGKEEQSAERSQALLGFVLGLAETILSVLLASSAASFLANNLWVIAAVTAIFPCPACCLALYVLHGAAFVGFSFLFRRYGSLRLLGHVFTGAQEVFHIGEKLFDSEFWELLRKTLADMFPKVQPI